MDITVVGSVALDSVETPYGKCELELGGAATYFSISASFFTRVNMIGVIGTDFPQEYIQILKSRNINIDGLKQVDGKTFRWSGRYHKDVNQRDTLDTQLNVFETFKPTISKEISQVPYLFLGNINPSLQLDVLRQAFPRFTGMDTMNLWIETTPDDLQEVLSRVDILFINDSEARQLSGEENLKKASREILALGPDVLIIKKGEHGCLLFFEDEETFMLPAYLLENVVDPTGAGDSFAGGFMGYLAYRNSVEPEVLRQATVIGTVIASFTCESFGPRRLLSLTGEEIKKRCCEFIQQTRIQDLSEFPF
ncbi:MAG TPA: PfkB family carbohydrate kinase [Candidatus Hydrogenedens sp.]|nr:PfkB family carbohydrate kinase [Candidatus Hydrogenedens sp.]